VAPVDLVVSLAGEDDWTAFSEGEYAYITKFSLWRRRKESAAANILARQAVAGALRVSLRSVAMIRESSGRPSVTVSRDGLSSHYQISIAHSGGLVAVALTPRLHNVRLGVDVEVVTQHVSSALFSRLSMPEQASLSLASPNDRPMLFGRYWTLKESLAKALGVPLPELLSHEVCHRGQAGPYYLSNDSGLDPVTVLGQRMVVYSMIVNLDSIVTLCFSICGLQEPQLESADIRLWDSLLSN